MKFAKLALVASAFAMTSVAAHAQDVGDTVYGNDGQAIGTIESTDGTNAVLAVGEFTAPLPLSIFGAGENGPTLNTTRSAVYDQLKAADDQAKAAAAAQAQAEAEAAAKLEAALVVGAPVITVDSMTLGMVNELTGDNVVIKSEDEQLITLPVSLMTLDTNGGLMALANHADIMAAVQAAGG